MLAGLLAGAPFLLNPSTILINIPWLAYLVLLRTAPRRQVIRYMAFRFLVLFAVGFGWMLRNRLVLGAFVVRTNLGSSLSASNNDCARPSHLENIRSGCEAPHNPNGSVSDDRLIASIGKVVHDSLRRAEATEWMREHPRSYFRLTLARFRNF